MKMKGTPMKIKRHLAPVAGVLLLVTGAASVALLGGGSASAAGAPSSAFGIELNLAGNSAIPPTPAVESTDGAPVSDSLVDVPAAPLAEAGVVTVSAQNGAAKSAVADLDLVLTQGPLAELATIGTQLQPLCDALGTINLDAQVIGQITDPVTGALLPALFDPIIDTLAGTPIDLSAITAIDLGDLLPEDLGDLCDFATSGNLLGATAVEASCTGDTGTTTIAATDGLLAALIDTNKANSRIAIEGLLEVVVNRQTSNADGTFTVDALYVNLLDQVELTVASATCGEVTRDNIPEVDDESDAPAPDPVETNIPVTG